MGSKTPARSSLRAKSEAGAKAAEQRPSEASIRALNVEPDSDHRREHSRYSVDLDVSVGSDHNFYAGFAENLSAGGVFGATHKPSSPGSEIELSITLPAHLPRPRPRQMRR